MGVLLAILAVFLLLGCVMDSMAIILIFVPLFTPRWWRRASTWSGSASSSWC
jgi:TRAP-type C4-dicarboxylate transport system permease large subunit